MMEQHSIEYLILYSKIHFEKQNQLQYLFTALTVVEEISPLNIRLIFPEDRPDGEVKRC